ncbi:hypothetical protein IMY05_017G0068500 [Salix suchowensis]|nr:hypothetical protein IMY05_017G0068500 [Salix suchowensis]
MTVKRIETTTDFVESGKLKKKKQRQTCPPGIIGDHYWRGEEKESLVVLGYCGGVASLPPLMMVMVSDREGEEG